MHVQPASSPGSSALSALDLDGSCASDFVGRRAGAGCVRRRRLEERCSFSGGRRGSATSSPGPGQKRRERTSRAQSGNADSGGTSAPSLRSDPGARSTCHGGAARRHRPASPPCRDWSKGSLSALRWGSGREGGGSGRARRAWAARASQEKFERALSAVHASQLSLRPVLPRPRTRQRATKVQAKQQRARQRQRKSWEKLAAVRAPSPDTAVSPAQRLYAPPQRWKQHNRRHGFVRV